MAEQKQKVRLSAAQRSKIRRLSAPKEASPDDGAGELNIVPFLDIIMNILMFVLATVAVVFTSTIETTPPSSGGGGVKLLKKSDSLNLTLIVTNDGVAIKAAGGNIAPGCDGIGAGIAIPAKAHDPGGQPDLNYKALASCVLKLKNQSSDFKDETQIRIMASNNINYDHIIGTMDAVRKAPDGTPLFPDVLFAVPR